MSFSACVNSCATMPGCNAVSYYPYPLEGLYENVCIYKSGYAAKASVNRFYDSAVLVSPACGSRYFDAKGVARAYVC